MVATKLEVRRALPAALAVYALLHVAPAIAQSSPDGAPGPETPPVAAPDQPPPYQPPPYQPSPDQPPTNQPPTYQPPTYQPPTYQPPNYQPPNYQPPNYQPGLPVQPGLSPMMVPPPPLPPLVVHRYRSGRIVYAVGNVLGLIGSGLSISSIFVTSVYGIGDNSGTLGPGLAYAGASASGTAVILTTVGLGLQHSALRVVGADPGRGLYGVGTAFGILGLASVGTSYYFRFASPNENAGTVAFAASITAAVLLGVGSVLYFFDARQMQRVYLRLTRF